MKNGILRLSWFHIALINLLIAALLGVFMRYYFVGEVSGFKFMNILYGHSHVALMGWGFIGLFSLIDLYFLEGHSRIMIRKNNVYRIAQVLVLGMLVTFPLLGYAPASIAISSLLILASYYLLWLALKAIWGISSVHPVVRKFLLAAIVWYFLSTLALWSMAPIMMSGLRGSPVYYMSIQFFLHFQVNGWFIFGIIGLALHFITKAGHGLRVRVWNRILMMLVVSTVLTYALAVSWSNPSPWVFAINSLGAFIQLVAIVLLFRELAGLRKKARALVDPWVYGLIGFAFICLGLKVAIQTAVILPPIAIIAYTIRNYVIGFLHLILLGMLTHFLLAVGFREKLLDANNTLARVGMITFSAGFILSETLLFLQGTLAWARLGMIPYFHHMLFVVSLLLPLGILLLVIYGVSRSFITHSPK